MHKRTILPNVLENDNVSAYNVRSPRQHTLRRKRLLQGKPTVYNHRGFPINVVANSSAIHLDKRHDVTSINGSVWLP